MNEDPGSSCVHSVMLTPADIPGAELNEPYEAHAIPALKCWLLCRGIREPLSCKMKQLLQR